MTSSFDFKRFAAGRPNAILGIILMLCFVGAAALGAFFTPYDPLAMDIPDRLAPPSAANWLGTDQFGRDVLSRMLIGARESLTISSLSSAGAMVLGIGIGATASYFGGWADRITGACLDALMAFPGLLLAMAIIAVAGPGKSGVIMALALAYTPAVVRVIRSSILSIKQREYIEASRSLGNPEWKTILFHVIPNCVGPLTVIGTSLFAVALLSESALSFLGLGVPPPYPTWGGMLADSKQFVASASWLVIFPGLAISMAVLAANLLGDALRDYFDPRMEAG